jgi:uncharacterized membrane protein
MRNNPRTQAMPDLFEGADLKKRPATVTILKERLEVYSYFRDFSHLPLFMKHLLRVEDAGQGKARWTAQENGREVNWLTEIVAEEPGKVIAWKSIGERSFDIIAAVTFEPALEGRATVVSFKVAYPATMGKLVGFARHFWGEDLDTRAAVNLRRLKALLETGEIPTTEGQSSGREESAAA